MEIYSIVAIECDEKVYDRIKKKAMRCSGGPEIYFHKKHYTYFLKWKWVEWFEHNPKFPEIDAIMTELDHILAEGAESGEFSFLKLWDSDDGLCMQRIDSSCNFCPEWIADIELPYGYEKLGAGEPRNAQGKKNESEMTWITDRLPEDDEKVLCCTMTKKGVKNKVIGYYAFDRWCCGTNSNVVAWMPLPEDPAV